MTAREEVVAFGNGGSLIGIVHHPAQFDARRPAILLISAGQWPRIGPLRLLVSLSRHLADLGFLCLRFDFSGVGESLAREDGVPRNRSDILETIEAMDYLESTFGARTFVGLGFCRGAWVCFAAAAEDARLTSLVLVQMETLVESHRTSAVWMEQSSRSVLESVGRLSSWKRLISGEADYRSRLAMLYVQLKTRLGVDSRQGESDRVAATLASLSARGVRILFLFSPDQAGYDYLQTVLKRQKQFRLPLAGMRIEIVSQRGHGLLTQAGQRALLQAAGDFIAGDSSSHFQNCSSVN